MAKKEMTYTRLNPDVIEELEAVAIDMGDMTTSGLIRKIIMDWLKKYRRKK